ncbi:MAG: DUF4294 domain-containing protein [bacterium]|nr:DUF4294 domain-containing protein [bacterium]
MNRFGFLLFAFMLCFSMFAQEDTTAMRTQELQAVRYDKNFDLHYLQQFNLIRRTYPLAVKAKEIIDSLDRELAAETKNRKKKKIAKERKKELEEELEYLIKDLYVGEGKMLFKLIHRETGMTVTEILAKYRGNLYAKTVEATFSLYGHETNSKFDAEGDDWIAELVLQDIESGRRVIDMNINGMTKSEYKQNLKEYREYRRSVRKKEREYKRNKRKGKR